MRLNHVFTLAAATGLLAMSVASQAAIITTITGTFSGMSGGTNSCYSTQGTSIVEWGCINDSNNQPIAGFNKSWLEFVGYSGTGYGQLSNGMTIDLGTLILHNGVTLLGTEATSMTLNLEITQTGDFTYSNTDSGTATIITTANVGVPLSNPINRDSICFGTTSYGTVPCQLADEGGTISVTPKALLGSIDIVDFMPITTGGAVTLFDANGHGYMRYIDDTSGRLVTVYVPEPPTAILSILGGGLLILTRLKKNQTKIISA